MKHVEEPHGISRRKLIRRIVGGSAVLGLATIAGYIGNEVLEALKGTVRSGEVLPHTSDSKERFSFLDYAPPAEGVIVKSRLVDVRGKTVIFIPDTHPVPGLSPESLAGAEQVQIEIYRLVEDLIRQYGKTAVVLENWPRGLNANDIKEQPEADAEASTDTEAADSDFELPHRIAIEPNLAKRKALTAKFLGKTFVPAGMLLMVTYQDEMIPLGSTTQEETTAVLEQAADFSTMERALKSPGEFICTSETGENQGLTVQQAMARFRSKRRTKQAIDCYCRFRATALGIREEFMQDRFIDAPRKEVFEALDYKGGEGFVVIIAGLNHLKEGLRILDEERVNYLIVSPQTIAGRCPEYIREPAAPPEIHLEDDARATCADWKRLMEE